MPQPSRTAMRTIKLPTVSPIHGGTPPKGLAIGCIASPTGPQMTIALSTGEAALVGLVPESDLDAVLGQLIAAAERMATMKAPVAEPEVRHG